ncbi:AzlD domain-containing protein [Pseudoflavonifractor phocaeensis]|uniref:branched-chain amino acid transporter permease n=1 Tax=Pseudoflavonifractor phocaeensis TaxID=1870988 RepID=UPI00195A8E95|nr:AzlD domain-containing protein [Pseudoflavonifractor phocaeensis]MBM6870170.1 AzlD domain-containing protein [Pseudoflavonifractor phocaeensis]MBM6938039.1 AzlD domain-containing protein [Pseudoflavonifractor phocaeensis]
MLTVPQAIAAIAVMALVTFFTRAVPFLLFDRGEHPPALVLYLGRVLPPAIIAMLIVYCLREAHFLTWLGTLFSAGTGLELAAVSSWLPAFLSVIVVVVLHLWKHNNLLSIFGGTVFYMVLIQRVFV